MYDLEIPRTRTASSGSRRFSLCVPTFWNSYWSYWRDCVSWQRSVQMGILFSRVLNHVWFETTFLFVSCKGAFWRPCHEGAFLKQNLHYITVVIHLHSSNFLFARTVLNYILFSGTVDPWNISNLVKSLQVRYKRSNLSLHINKSRDLFQIYDLPLLQFTGVILQFYVFMLHFTDNIKLSFLMLISFCIFSLKL